MLFNSVEFIVIFLPMLLATFSLLKGDGARKYLLIFASFIFYGWWDPRYVLLLAGSIAGNYLTSAVMRRTDGIQRRAALIFGLAWNLGLLGYFKYADFFIENVNRIFDLEYFMPAIMLPLAISFFTFQQIAFLIDTHRGAVGKVAISDYVLFVVFFPQLVAGPIVHHNEMLPQFRRPGAFALRLDNVQVGLFIASVGLLKKVLLADGIARFSDQVFSVAGHQTLTLLEAWFGALAFGLQIYFDFSAYSDIAVGVALLFGITLPINFLSPYKARNVIDFWRSWHITLSRFLRYYLYIPLGGNRHGEARRYLNLLVVMLLGGLWHGAGWNFVIWGGLHGTYLAINHLWRATVGQSRSKSAELFGWLLTFLCVMAAWVPFRAADLDATISIYQGMAGMNGIILPSWLSKDPASAVNLVTQVLSPGAMAFLMLLLAIVLLLPNTYQLASYNGHFAAACNTRTFLGNIAGRRVFAFGIAVLAILASLAFMLDEPQNFIYFQF